MALDKGKAAREQAESLLQSFKAFRQEKGDWITALKNAKDKAESVLVESKPLNVDAALTQIETKKVASDLAENLKSLRSEAKVPKALREAKETLLTLAGATSNEVLKKGLNEEIALIDAKNADL